MTVRAQGTTDGDPSLGRFVIGVDAVGPSTEFPNPNTRENGGTWLHWAGGAQITPGICDEDDIPLERWEQLRDLGIDLACITLSHHALYSDGVSRIRRMAAEHDILLGFADMGVGDGATNYSALERIVYQVESPWMVLADSVIRASLDGFRFLRQDVSSYPLSREYNALLFPSSGVPHGWLIRRLPDSHPESSMYQGTLRSDGVYYISLRLQYLPAGTALQDRIPDDTTTVFLLTIEDEDPATKNSYTLRGSDFFSSGAVIDSVSEFLLDIVRVTTDDASGTVRIARGLLDSVNAVVTQAGRNNGDRIVPDVGANRLPFRLEYMPFSTRRPVIAVDGIAISCGLAFALFNHSSPALPDTWRPRPWEYLSRHIDTLCAPSTAPPPVYVQLQESIASTGNIATTAYVSEYLADRSAGHTLPFVYLPAVTGRSGLPHVIPAFSNALLSLYSYPYSVDRDSEMHPAPIPCQDSYNRYHYQERHSYPTMRGVTEDFRRSTEVRQQAGVRSQWIACIQNYAYGFLDGDPNGNPTGDPVWTREPTTAELRLSVNMALAYGAKGIQYYTFSGTPGTDTTDMRRLGARGFLTFDHCKRATNPYGENPWDTMRAFHHAYLRVVGDTLFPLAWREAWSVEQWDLGMPQSNVVRRIRTSDDDAFDDEDATYVETALFEHPGAPGRVYYLLLINKRVCPGASRRVSVALGGGEGNTSRWRVTRVLNGETVDVHAFDPVDAAAGRESFGVHIPPGMGELLRLDAVEQGPAAPLPSDLQLENAFPNPVSGVVTIPFTTPFSGEHRLIVVDALSRTVLSRRTSCAPGRNSISIETSGLIPGVYFFRLRASGLTGWGRLVVQH